jgi:hypothetical protein
VEEKLSVLMVVEDSKLVRLQEKLSNEQVQEVTCCR